MKLLVHVGQLLIFKSWGEDYVNVCVKSYGSAEGFKMIDCT